MENVTGIMVYYYRVCKKKLWYFANEIQMEHTNEDVFMGKLVDEASYNREEKHINIDDMINIDYIKASNTIHEVKKSKKIEEASILQVKYYLYYLRNKGIEGIKAKIDYPLLKQSIEIELTDKDCEDLNNIVMEIKDIVSSLDVPKAEIKGFCKKCAYYDICCI